jgi:chorismate mutase
MVTGGPARQWPPRMPSPETPHDGHAAGRLPIAWSGGSDPGGSRVLGKGIRPVAVRAIRGAVQIDANERTAVLDGTTELVTEVMTRNGLVTDDVISVVFTATPDLTAEFPALAARKIGFQDVPLLCASEIDVPGALPRVVRLLMHVETGKPRAAVQHVYLRGAAALRLDIAQ